MLTLFSPLSFNGNSRLGWKNPLAYFHSLHLLQLAGCLWFLKHKTKIKQKRKAFLEWSHSLKTTQRKTITKMYAIDMLPTQACCRLITVLLKSWFPRVFLTPSHLATLQQLEHGHRYHYYQRYHPYYYNLYARVGDELPSDPEKRSKTPLPWSSAGLTCLRWIWGKHCTTRTFHVIIRRWSVFKLT